jgi:SAM-dependent methyltransferase
MTPELTGLEDAPCPMGCAPNDEVLWRGIDRQHPSEVMFQVVRCRDCTLMRTNPRPTIESMSAYYPSTYAPHAGVSPAALAGSVTTGLMARLKRGMRMDGTRDLVPPEVVEGRVLEVGCADGRFLSKLRERGLTGVGIEPSERAAASARARGFEVWTGGLESCPGFAEPFDLVVASHAFEHLHAPLDSFYKLRSWCTDRAWLACSVPDAGSLAARIFGSAWYDLDVPRHLFHYTPHTLSAVLARAGWRVEHTHWQRTLNSWMGSLAYGHFERWGASSRLGRHMLASTRSSLFRNLVWPLSGAFAAVRQSGRFVVWARAS